MLTPQDLARFDQKLPRYTSYPTVPSWGPLPPSAVPDALAAVDQPVQLYVHVPFCEQQCRFCACNQVVAGRQDAGDRFLDDLALQVGRMPRLHVNRLHLGGGTPTWLDCAQLTRLMSLLRGHFHMAADADLSLEADPEVTTAAQLQVLHDAGFRRLSLGVQSFDPKVLLAVDRPQLGDRVAGVLECARALGWRGLNLDVMYGLPHQTLESFQATLDHVVTLRPDRLAVFGYAHVPWLRRHQRAIDADALPDVHVRSACVLAAQTTLRAAGYVPIGFDHFALPDDALAVGPRTRNFMGYSTTGGDLVGLGPSAISDVGGLMWQDEPKLGAWSRKVRQDQPLALRGWRRDDDDRIRESIIRALLCDLQVDIGAVEASWGLDFGAHFHAELDALLPLMQQDLVDVDLTRVRVTERGRPLVRVVAALFDARRSQARFSSAV